MQPSEYTDDQFEGVFYNTLREESRISVSFASDVFYNSFQTKFLADFANRIQKDNSNCSYTCSMQFQMLKCDLKLDSSSKTVIIAGVGRILWRKDCFARITRAIFKQFVFLSEKGNDSCEQQMKENLTCEKNGVVTCTPFIRRTDFQVNNAVQEPNFYSTPIVQRGKAQTSGDHVFSHSTPVMQKPGLQTVDSSVNTHQSAYAPFTPMVPILVPPKYSYEPASFQLQFNFTTSSIPDEWNSSLQ